ncbi:MAG: aminopeptidase [Lachnospiraceae bacterium]|nr:aminopeptidase [Lachnospiraceae bacterium]
MEEFGNFEIESTDEILKERLELSCIRLKEIAEDGESSKWFSFFCVQASLLLRIKEIADRIGDDVSKVPADELKAFNKELYADILPENYENSYTNPDHAKAVFGEKCGSAVSVIAAEMRSAIACAFENDTDGILIRMELLLELYSTVRDFLEEQVSDEELAEYLRKDIYLYVSDYYETESVKRIADLVDPGKDFAYKIISSNISSSGEDTDYLYRFGEYITENEIKTAKFLASLKEDEIESMASTFTEGYRRGFVLTGKDLSKKTSVNIRYPLGFERIIKKVIDNFEATGLKCVIYRAKQGLFRNYSVSKNGFFGANPNPQYDFDHQEDQALILDGQLVTRHLECLKAAWEQYHDKAKGHAGPAVLECFGTRPFVPKRKQTVLHLSEKQQKIATRFRTESGTMTNHYIPGEERSFTIMALPVPEIGDDFEDIFKAVIKINTLDNEKFTKIQQSIIDVLDTAEYIHVKGMKDNRTDLTVHLMKLEDPGHQTKFENCVADVNIPVGEVFTTPVLKGTNGVLHVTGVYLNELEFKDLELDFTDGRVSGYSCGNFEDESECRKYIEENILFHQKDLPMGEAAIGTNTTAYVLSRKYGFEAFLPILIAEKTGPHFAVGDSCYSHAEDISVYNPDGKEIVSRDNEISILRKDDPLKAYFNCHTDVTIPYEELGLLEAVGYDGTKTVIIKDGRFSLPGTEELNKAFEEY